jgi:hypothetical protein
MIFKLMVTGILLLGQPIYAASVYMTDSANQFGTLDLETGVFTPIAVRGSVHDDFWHGIRR